MDDTRIIRRSLTLISLFFSSFSVTRIMSYIDLLYFYYMFILFKFISTHDTGFVVYYVIYFISLDSINKSRVPLRETLQWTRLWSHFFLSVGTLLVSRLSRFFSSFVRVLRFLPLFKSQKVLTSRSSHQSYFSHSFFSIRHLSLRHWCSTHLTTPRN